MQELFQRLFESSFMPHGHCYLWKPGLVWLQAGSDSLMAVAYFMIAVLLFWFVRNRKDLAFKWMFALGSVVFALCAVTHVMGVWTIWQGSYWLDGSIRFVAGVGSIATALLFIPVMPRALELPSPTQLRKANQALEEEIEQRRAAEAELAEKARELEEAYEQLQETEQMKDEFFANVSHELRTPLTLILSPLETMLEEGEDELPTRQRHLLRTAHNNSSRLLQMVNGLLDFSRLEIGEVAVDREPTDITELTGRIWEDFQPLLERKKLDGRLEATVEEPVIAVDRYLYERILFNLLSNAVKFTPKGGEVDVSVTRSGERLQVSVADTGIGIAEEELENIFKDFRQVDASATRRFEGTGLGLPLVKEFTELLGGSVTVESVPGEGSTFTVQLQAPGAAEMPIPEEEKESWAAAPQYDPADEMNAGSSEAAKEEVPEVVLAEDNDEMAAYLEELLTGTCRICRAADGEQALSLIRQLRPHAVITDVMMPGKDGLTVCRELKDDPAIADIPVVMLTALTDRKALLRGWEAGADEYLFKPFHPKEIVTRMRTLLTNIERRQAAERRADGLQRELLRISERERRRIGQDLHDGLASHISGISMLVQSLVEEDGGSMVEKEILQEIVNLAQEGARQARAMSRGLNPVKLDRQGLAAALKTLAQTGETRFDLACRFEEIGELPNLSEEAATNLYWIGQEALTNAAKHAEADRVIVCFGTADGETVLEICDDGTGLPPSAGEGNGGMGLRTMRYRADLIGASLTFEERSGGGLCVRCRMPRGV